MTISSEYYTDLALLVPVAFICQSTLSVDFSSP